MNKAPRFHHQSALAGAHDLAMAAISFPLSLWLRVGYMPFDLPFARVGFLLFIGVAAVVFFFSGLHRGVWRYASLPDLLVITRAVSLTPVTCGRWQRSHRCSGPR